MPTATPLFTAAELASALHVHPDTIRNLTASGGIPALRVGAQYRYDLGAVRQALAMAPRSDAERTDPVGTFLASDTWQDVRTADDIGQIRNALLLPTATDMWAATATTADLAQQDPQTYAALAPQPRPSLVQLVETIPFSGMKVAALTETTAGGHYARGRAIGEPLPETSIATSGSDVDPVDFGTRTVVAAKLMANSGRYARRTLERILREDVMEGLSWELVNGDGTDEAEGGETTTHLQGLAAATITDVAVGSDTNREALMKAGAAVLDAGYTSGPIVAVVTPQALLAMSLARNTADNFDNVGLAWDPIDAYIASTAIPATEGYVGSWFDAIALHLHDSGVRISFHDQHDDLAAKQQALARTLIPAYAHVRAPSALRHVTGLDETATT